MIRLEATWPEFAAPFAGDGGPAVIGNAPLRSREGS